MGRRSNDETLRIRAETQLGDLRNVSGELDSLSDSIGGLDDAGQSAGQGADSAGGGISSLMDFASAAIPVMIGLGAAMGAIGGAGDLIGGVLDANAATNLLEAQTGLTGEALQELVDIGDNIFVGNWGDSLDDVHGALQRVRNITQLQGDELEAATTHAIAFNDIFGSDVVESTRAASTMAKNFGISYGEAFDILAFGMQATGDPADDLLDTFNEYGDVFAQLGLDGPMAMNLLAQGVASTGRNTDELGDALQEFGIRLEEGFDPSVLEKFDDVSLQTYENFKSGNTDAAGFLENFIWQLRQIEDPSERAALGVAVFGTRFEELEDGILAFDPTSAVDGFHEIDGTMTDAEDAVSRGIGPAWSSLKRTMGIEFTRALEPTIVALSEDLIPVIEDFSDWIISDGIPALNSFMDTVNSIGGSASFAIDLGGDIFDQAKTDGLGNTLLAGLDMAGESAGSFITDTFAPAILAELSNPDNWTAASSLSRDILSFAVEGAADANEAAGKFALDSVINPLIDALTNTENWTKAAMIYGVIMDAIGAAALGAAEGGLNIAGEFVQNSIIDPILGALSGGEDGGGFSVDAIEGAIGGFGAVLFDALGLTMPDPIEWVSTSIVSPILGALSGLSNGVKGALNDAIPDSVDFEVGLDIPGDPGPLGLWGPQFVGVTASMNLPNPFNLEARAMGGDVFAGRGYLVGERGPEAFFPGVSGSIASNSAMGGMNFSGPITVNGVQDVAGFYDELQNYARTRG